MRNLTTNEIETVSGGVGYVQFQIITAIFNLLTYQGKAAQDKYDKNRGAGSYAALNPANWVNNNGNYTYSPPTVTGKGSNGLNG